MMLLTATVVQAQITIGGNVYGGGNAGDTHGATAVTVCAGDINGVFGGARMANVQGSAFVHIDGKHASNYIVINKVYGGNDIAGTIGTSTTLPAVFEGNANGVDNSWNAFVRISTKTITTGQGVNAVTSEADDAQKIYIGQLFGGGNGEYDYTSEKLSDNTTPNPYYHLVKPELGKTYLDIHGGSIVYAYGGGNAATVTDKTVICLDNPSKVVNSIKDANNNELLTNDRFENKMGINITFSYPESDAFQIGRLFGGNNKADMAIRPRWNLQRGSVRNLYGGGNEGRMTSPEGLLLQIEGAGMTVDNVYGGCRKADVRPLYNNNDETPVPDNQIELDPADNPNNIPGGYAARVRVLGGHVNNVYGGNDISGNVYGGNTVGILTHIYGNVYGGGNGSYAYTDNAKLKDNPKWSDFYYDPDKILQEAGITGVADKLKSATALNLFRPNAEKVSVYVKGTETEPVIVDGALYVGGNSASLRNQTATSSTNNRQTHIKIGSYVTIDNVFLGNNGENMIKYDEAEDNQTLRGEGVLRTLARTDQTSDGSKFNSMDLTDKDVFAQYMEGCAMKVKPTVVFESTKNGDRVDYIPYTTKFGSFFCGGNVGSILVPGKITVDFEDNVIIYDKVVGGCNNANVNATAYNAEYLGGMLGDPESVPTGSPEGTIGDKLELNFSGLKIQPKRWNADKTALVWNTISSASGAEVNPTNLSTGTSNAADLDRRLSGGNIYGGCYNSGHVNGNVIINLNTSVVDRKGEYGVFDEIEVNEGEALLYGNENYNILQRRSGVILDEQGMDVLGKALNVFGGGYGEGSEIWGSTTINLNKGYTFQIFGGGEKGAIGKGVRNPSTQKLEYTYDPRYSCYVNMKGIREGVYRGHADDNDDMAEAEFIYGGAFEAPIAGNTQINLGNGRIFNSFGGSCNANILGHTETFIGRNGVDASGNDVLGFPWVRDHVYGGNDLGGRILNTQSFMSRVSDAQKGKVYNPMNKVDGSNPDPDVVKASAYMEYIQGRVDYIFGGCYGYYDYRTPHFKDYTYTNGATDATSANLGTARPGFVKPRMDNAFVNFKPTNHSRNAVAKIYGAGQGYSGDSDRDIMQDRSYILIDIPQNITKYQNLEVFGAGDYSGVGMRNEAASALATALNPTITKTNADGVTGAAVIDLMRGQVKDVFGASYKEGVTRRTIVNVPVGSTVRANRIFGGAYGVSNDHPCDVYEANINYNSDDALVGGYRTGIFGGNNNCRRTLYSFVNINSPVWYNKDNGYLGTVFGGGYGENTWSQYTEVNLNNGARVYEAYGGGYGGMVLNEQSVKAWTEVEKSLGNGYTDEYLESDLVKPNKLGIKCNATVNINQGANVSGYLYNGSISGGYCYGGGYGATATVSGTTYIGLHGGTVVKDLYAGGTSGAVMDKFKLASDDNTENDFVATTNAYIEGGTVRNVYGGGWEGNVGYTKMVTVGANTTVTENIPGATNVVIGIRKDQTTLPDDYGFYKGVPAIQRNAYGGGEGGAVYGSANLTMNNGYIGYFYDTDREEYYEKIHDETWSDHIGLDRLSDCGNIFGGGYDDNSSVDQSHVTMWGGIVRNSLFGGGEIATIGRGKTRESGVDNKVREIDAIYKAGGTRIEMFNGHVKRNVFGGGKGYNILGYGGIHGFYTDGYVFGQTEVHIHGGEVGTNAGLADGYGNVFGGGDVGYVYSRGYFSEKSQQGIGTGAPNHTYYYDNDGKLTEDCKVVIAPMLQVRPGQSINYDNKTYGPYEYMPTDYLNTLPAKSADGTWTGEWPKLFTGDGANEEERGVIIHNAVFAGGNVSSNSISYNNATTVFGNTTATLYDVFHRDFISVGTEHTGGLYGGGNLSMVNGYRELNITNYGTDYYGLDQQITLAAYQKLSNRERAYFKLEYQCQQDVTISGKDYKTDDRISEEDYERLPEAYKNETYWKQFGFCSIYAGRLLNTIQRADFCGVFGSRLVLQGAKDRVAEVGDATEYTINRIGELSLNQHRSVAGDRDEKNEPLIHGNYFGIYSIVNYLGGLTSDVHYTDDYRYMENGETKESTTGDTYYTWKSGRLTKRDRNNGTSYNQVALASGVFLELTSENSTPNNKIYGDVTGIIELDLINVKKDIEGGGYVYARNEHRVPKCFPNMKNVLLSEYNKENNTIVNGQAIRDEAFTNKRYYYTNDNLPTGDEATGAFVIGENADQFGQLRSYQTSGNFIHRSKRIIDDCYPNTGVYDDGYVQSPAHYWFIKGEVYVYDQVVSAYAGSATAYHKEVKIPLTITAGSNGRLQLLNIQPNLYAYYNNSTDRTETNKINADGVKVDNERTTFYLNDIITWWDWHQLADNEKKYFVKETYVNVDTCTVDGISYPSGTYVLENDPSVHTSGQPTAYQSFLTDGHTVLDKKNNPVTNLARLFHPSNNIGHDTGYALTFDMNSPNDWDDWYSPITGSSADGKIKKEAYDLLTESQKLSYREGPTYTLKPGESSGLYGQREYSEGEIISKEVYDDYTSTISRMSEQPTGQATVEPAYVALAAAGNIQAGNAISETAYNALSDKTNFEPAMVCINTIQLGDEDYVLIGELVSATDASLNALATRYKEYNNGKLNADPVTQEQALKYVKDNLSKAYYCTSDGLYGGQFFESGTNYTALKSWCALTDSRDKFQYNYDALDLLIDPTYPGEDHTSVYHSPYSDEKQVEYSAVYLGTGTYNYEDEDGTPHTITKTDGPISNVDFEKIKNEQRHYTRLEIEVGGKTVYIVKDNIINNGTPYAKGQSISERDYNSFSTTNKGKVATKTIPNTSGEEMVVYYCYDGYGTEDGKKTGDVISSETFAGLENYQKAFTIQGMEPTETTTLYVSRESNTKDLTSDKIISVVYQYTYYEQDDEGEGVSMVNELHVVNIRLKMESGAPEIGVLSAPPAVLPGSTMGLKAPSVNPGLYEVLTSGWELFSSEHDAENRQNGIPFVVNGTPLYWYQNQKVWLAFYSKTYLGKTYSNYVPLTVANYHDIDAVMADKEHHLYVDHPDVMRHSKIYINGSNCESDATKSKLDLLKDLFDLSVNGDALDGHAPLDPHVRGGANLEFVLTGNVSPKKYTNWTPIGDATNCFQGNLHGDGYTVSNLNNSLFGNLCGSVYNLGVNGSFTSAGVADMGDGYLENCWINTSATSGFPAGVKALLGNPTATGSKQVVNCYYPETKAYAASDAHPVPETQFYNGTVAYNLNAFYLNKRYYDHNVPSGTPTEYYYLRANDDGTLSEELSTGRYPASPDATYGYVGYVERRFADGDFIYADGSVPESSEMRMRTVTVGNTSKIVYAPIWPDDYLFFGQSLTYGYNPSRQHGDVPTRITKDGGRLSLSETSNRVYRAPAYYQSKTMGSAHYNLSAILAAHSAPKSLTDTDLKPAYPNMTAIDFAGHNDNTWRMGSTSDGCFYPPLLDNADGLINIVNEGETPNMLVYAPDEETNKKTYDVLTEYFVDPDYASYYIDDDYRRVASASAVSVQGHLIQGDLTATTDHLLVDKKDFNCPIAYSFADGYRMWYQRIPDNYAEVVMSGTPAQRSTKGWETVSLPFTAELVTTQQKGEITHFYSGSRSIGENGAKIGHEYWLRDYQGKKANSGDTFIAAFNYPTAHGGYKAVGNTFLWDYYYSANSQLDNNTDEYQTYYQSSRSLPAYPLLTAATPYLVGFPGQTYYEFDLSGEWTAKNTSGTAPAKLDKQVITFAAAPSNEEENSVLHIGISDDEQAGTPVDGYIFRPNYGSKSVEGYLLNADGNRFEVTTSATEAIPFRPYFVSEGASPARKNIQYITFEGDGSSFVFGDEDPSEGEVGEGTLLITANKHKVIVTSSLRAATDVSIVNMGGLTIASFTIQPGETIHTNLPVSGVYVVRAAGGYYQKKLAVK